MSDEPEKARVNKIRMVPGAQRLNIFLCPQCRNKFKEYRPEGPAYEAWRAARSLPIFDPDPLCGRCWIQRKVDAGWRWVRLSRPNSWHLVAPAHPDWPDGQSDTPSE